MMRIGDPQAVSVQPEGSAADAMRKFDGTLTMPFYAIHASLKHALVCWHATGSGSEIIKHLKDEATGFSAVYSAANIAIATRHFSAPLASYAGIAPFHGMRDNFEMALAMAVALTNEVKIAKGLKSQFSYAPRNNGYAYYVGLKQALLGMMLEDDTLLRSARDLLTKFNAAKSFYYPSDAVIFAAMDGDLKKLKVQVNAISRKFDGYAQKCKAVVGDKILVGALDSNWFSPYSDWAFYAQAIRRFGPVAAEGTFWMPMTWLNSYATK